MSVRLYSSSLLSVTIGIVIFDQSLSYLSSDSNVFADITEPIAGGAGYLGAGLLGLVLSWLMLKYLPEERQFMLNYLASKDLQIEKMEERHIIYIERTIKELREESEKGRLAMT